MLLCLHAVASKSSLPSGGSLSQRKQIINPSMTIKIISLACQAAGSRTTFNEAFKRSFKAMRARTRLCSRPVPINFLSFLNTIILLTSEI